MELGCGGEPSPGHAREGVEAGPVCAQPALPRPSMAGGEQEMSPLSKGFFQKLAFQWPFTVSGPRFTEKIEERLQQSQIMALLV